MRQNRQQVHTVDENISTRYLTKARISYPFTETNKETYSEIVCESTEPVRNHIGCQARNPKTPIAIYGYPDVTRFRLGTSQDYRLTISTSTNFLLETYLHHLN